MADYYWATMVVLLAGDFLLILEGCFSSDISRPTLTQSSPCFYKPVNYPSQKSQASLAAFSDHHIQPPDGWLVLSLDGSSQLALLPTQHCFLSKPF